MKLNNLILTLKLAVLIRHLLTEHVSGLQETLECFPHYASRKVVI
jgi:hypothetical protein